MTELSIRHADCQREFLQISWTLSSLIILAVSFAVSSAKVSCGGTIDAPNGTITSPSNPYSPYEYPRNQHCLWEIMVRPLHRFILNFNKIDLGTGDCVVVRSISNSGEKFERGKYCSTPSSLPPPIELSGLSHLLIEFTSDDYYDSRSGFEAFFFSENGDAYKNHSIDMFVTSRDPLFYEYDFDPVHLEQKLINISFSQYLTSEQYRYELKRLIRTIGSPLQSMSGLKLIYFINSLPDREDPDENTLANTITYKRLALMFPEYFRFDLVELDVRNFSPQCEKLNGILPEIMKHPEFAGLIPTSSDGALKESERNALIVAHLYWQFCNVADAKRSDEYLEKLGSIAMKRIELSRLPNELRIKALKAKRIIDDDGRFFGTDLELSNHVPSQVHYIATDFPNFAKI